MDHNLGPADEESEAAETPRDAGAEAAEASARGAGLISACAIAHVSTTDRTDADH